MSKAGTRWVWLGRVLKNMTSRNSRQEAKESKVFFMVLMATYSHGQLRRRQVISSNSYHCTTSSNTGATGSDTGKSNTSKASITNFFQYFESVFQSRQRM